MKPETQRIAIAEAHTNGDYRVKLIARPGIRHYAFNYSGRDDFGGAAFGNCKDYITDLNAMCEAEKAVLVRWDDPKNAGHYVWKDSYGVYIGWLSKLTESLYFHPKADSTEFAKLISATAAQRAEAFLRTIGKWVD